MLLSNRIDVASDVNAARFGVGNAGATSVVAEFAAPRLSSERFRLIGVLTDTSDPSGLDRESALFFKLTEDLFFRSPPNLPICLLGEGGTSSASTLNGKAATVLGDADTVVSAGLAALDGDGMERFLLINEGLKTVSGSNVNGCCSSDDFGIT